jgi:hypothetical protein
MLLCGGCSGAHRVGSEHRCLAMVGCPTPKPLPTCVEQQGVREAGEFARAISSRGTFRDGRHNTDPAPGTHTVQGFAHRGSTVCTEEVCWSKDPCCNSCGAQVMLLGKPRIDVDNDPEIEYGLTIGVCKGDDTLVCCTLPTGGAPLQVTFLYDGNELRPTSFCVVAGENGTPRSSPKSDGQAPIVPGATQVKSIRERTP